MWGMGGEGAAQIIPGPSTIKLSSVLHILSNFQKKKKNTTSNNNLHRHVSTLRKRADVFHSKDFGFVNFVPFSSSHLLWCPLLPIFSRMRVIVAGDFLYLFPKKAMNQI